jgi:hypothetical protein
MDKSQKGKGNRPISANNVVESLKDLGTTTVKTAAKDLLAETSRDFLRELLGGRIEKKFSGEIAPGESLELTEVFQGKATENQKLRNQISLERTLSQEEKSRVEKEVADLRIQLHALMGEIYSLSMATQGLGEQVEVAAMQVPVNPGVYHLIFFEKLLEFVRSFRKKIEEASIWLTFSNKRAEKKNFWSIYKKHGSKFLLSPDHYLQRSAG